MIGRLLSLAVGAAIVLLVAGLTHFTAVLLLPSVATRDAYDLLASQASTGHGAPNHMVLLPPSRPGDFLIPFRDPAAVQALCFYDLSKAPVRVKTKTEEGLLLALSFRTPQGSIFYSMTDRAALRETIDIRLVTQHQLNEIEANDIDSEGLPEELRLKSPGPKGLIVATALIARPGERQDAEKRLKAITCAPEAIVPPS